MLPARIRRMLRAKMVLPVRIELTTSALPRMRSTTELRQHFVRRGAPYDGRPLALSTRLKRRAAGILSSMSKDKEREERLAAALRENLRRRKAQTREMKADENEKSRGSEGLGVAVAERFFAERAPSRRKRVANPDEGANERMPRTSCSAVITNRLREFPLAATD